MVRQKIASSYTATKRLYNIQVYSSISVPGNIIYLHVRSAHNVPGHWI